MINPNAAEHLIHCVTNFNELVSTPFNETMNALCWSRTLKGDFAEIVSKVVQTENITVLDEQQLGALELSEQGQLARAVLLQDFNLLSAHGALPTLNVIRHYERDNSLPFFATDVYSFHADRSPVPTDTFLCTYYGAPSEILPNTQVQQKVLVPEIRDKLNKLYGGPAEGFDAFLEEHFFDLHYQALPGAVPISLGLGNMWRLAIDHPGSKVLPCIHRAPVEKNGQPRLLMIC
jgi:hypothetical protein